jgi:hypothetical protein
LIGWERRFVATDEEIRPVAERLYQEDQKEAARRDWQRAQNCFACQLVNPSEEEVRVAAYNFYKERVRAMQDDDWYCAECHIRRNGGIWIE